MAVQGENSPLLGIKSNGENRIRSNIIMACLFGSQYIASMDSTMVVTLLNRISSDFDSQQHVSWIATSYLLSCAAFQPLFGKLSDVMGRKVMLTVCQLVFALGCSICATSQSLSMLILGRTITGIGGGGMQTLTSICISDIVSLKDRGLYQGYISISWQMGVISGGLIAGIFDAIWGWKFAFWVQVPCVLTIAILVIFFMDLPVDKKHHHISSFEKLKGIDWFGSFLLVTSLLCVLLLFGTSRNEITPGGSFWYALVFYSIIGFSWFYKWESMAKSPVIPVRLLQHQTVVKTCLNSLFAQMNYYGALYYLPFYWTSVKNDTPLEAGYRLIPTTFTACTTSVIVGYLIKKVGKYHMIHLIAGGLIIIGSIFIFTQNQSYGFIMESILPIPMRIGASMNFNVMIISMISSVSPDEQSLVSSIHYGVKSTGSTLGVSICNAIMQWALGFFMNIYVINLDPPKGWNLDSLKELASKALNNPSIGFDETIPESVRNGIVSAYDSACHSVFAFMILCSFFVFLAIWKTEENSLEESDQENE